MKRKAPVELNAVLAPLLFAIGVAVASVGLGVGCGYTPHYDAWGFASGVVLTLHVVLLAISVDMIGTTVSSAVTSVVAAEGAFVLGCLVLDNSVWSSSLACGSLTLIAVGLFGVCWAEPLARYLDGAEECSPLIQPLLQDAKWESSTLAMKFAGVLISIVSGLCGASILLPMVLRSQSPESLLSAFGAGTLLTATIIWIGAMVVSKFLGRSVDAISKIPDIRTFTAAMCAGMLWSIGNAVAAVSVTELGYARVYPLFHCQVAIVTMWQAVSGTGVRGRALSVLSGATLALFLGGTMLILVTHV